MTEIPMEKITQAPLFNGLSEAEVEKVLSLARRVEWHSGDTIVTEDEAGETMYVVYSGAMKVSKRLTLPQFSDELGQDEKTLLHMDASEPVVIGEVAMLSKAERSATITATSDCAGLEIRGPDLAELCESDTELGFKIVRNLAQLMSARLRQANRDIVKLATALSVAVSHER